MRDVLAFIHDKTVENIRSKTKVDNKFCFDIYKMQNKLNIYLR